MATWTAVIDVQPIKTEFFIQIKGENVEQLNSGIEISVKRVESNDGNKHPLFEVVYFQKPGQWLQVINNIEVNSKIKLKKSDKKWITALKDKAIILLNDKGTIIEVPLQVLH